MNIHSSSIIHSKAEIHDSVSVGAFSIVDDNVEIGEGTVIHPHVHIFPNTKIGKNNVIHQGAVIGGVPQDLKFSNEFSEVVIGDENVIREYCTINRGTESKHKTFIGNNCLLMAYVHIAHDCIVNDKVILANGVQLAGHTTIGYHAIIGGMTGVHQFCEVGEHAFVGACRVILQDIPPYILATGDPLKYSGINSVGLRRREFSSEQRRLIKNVYKVIYRSKLNITQALKELKTNFESTEEVLKIINFIETCERGII
tara:strand:+ start:9 stop:776 length:768 start_codon:yes stop_codon:yes gene_type:complete